MTRIVIGAALSMTLLGAVACSSGSSPASPSASPAFATPSTTTFAAQPPAAGSSQPTTFSPLREHGDSDEGHGHEQQLEGVIATIDAAHQSFVVGTTTVKVAATTIIRHGHTLIPFGDLVAGMRVHVKGQLDGAAIAAREIFVQTGEHDEDENEVEGVVSGKTGTCPAITFNVGTVKVTTTAATTFRHGDCAAVVDGAHVEVEGTIQPDMSIVAGKVSLDHEGDDDGD